MYITQRVHEGVNEQTEQRIDRKFIYSHRVKKLTLPKSKCQANVMLTVQRRMMTSSVVLIERRLDMVSTTDASPLHRQSNEFSPVNATREKIQEESSCVSTIEEDLANRADERKKNRRLDRIG